MKNITGLLVLLALAFGAAAQTSNSIAQYLSIRSASAPSLTPNGRRMFYLSNASGTSQIWAIDLPNGTPKRITNYEDNVSFVSVSPAGDGVVYGKARGGDENTQLFWIKPDGTSARALTDAPKVRHNYGGWSADGRRIYYASNKRNPQFFDIYRLTIADGTEELVYRFDGNNSFEAASPDDAQIIVSRTGTELSLDSDLFLVDIRAKTETHLTPHRGAAEFGHAHFASGAILYAHNDGREFYSLAEMKQKNAANRSDWRPVNRVTSIVDNTAWDVEDVALSQFGAIAYAINREGFSELYLRGSKPGRKKSLDAPSVKTQKIALPGRGVVGGLNFSGDGRKLAFSFSSSLRNTDIWIYDLSTKALFQVTQSDRAGVDAASFVEPDLVKYKSFDGREIPAWYYKPPNAQIQLTPIKTRRETAKSILPNRPIPVIVSVHGGPEGQSRPSFDALAQYYVSRGYGVLATNVRGSTGYGKTYTHLDDVKKREDSVRDLAFAVEWLKASGGGDPSRIAVMGGSYGGYMTLAAVTLYPDLWAAAVDTVGIVNWETFLKNTSGYRRRQREVEYGRLDRDLTFLRSISPIAKVDKIKAPLFVIHGKNDPRVPYTEAEQLVNALRQRGASVEYKLFDDEGHGISKLKNRLVLYPLVADFLDKYLR